MFRKNRPYPRTRAAETEISKVLYPGRDLHPPERPVLLEDFQFTDGSERDITRRERPTSR